MLLYPVLDVDKPGLFILCDYVVQGLEYDVTASTKEPVCVIEYLGEFLHPLGHQDARRRFKWIELEWSDIPSHSEYLYIVPQWG